MQEQPTKDNPPNTKAWADFLAFNTGAADLEVERQLCLMVDSVARFVRGMKEKRRPHWLSLLGTSGAGKTYLAKKVYKWHSNSGLFDMGNFASGEEVIDARHWINWSEFAGLLQSNRGYGLMQDLIATPFCVIDEVGADRDPNGHVRDCLSRVLSARTGKWTLITSNRSLRSISETIDQRISSRMIRDGSVVVDVTMPDYFVRK